MLYQKFILPFLGDLPSFELIFFFNVVLGIALPFFMLLSTLIAKNFRFPLIQAMLAPFRPHVMGILLMFRLSRM